MFNVCVYTCVFIFISYTFNCFMAINSTLSQIFKFFSCTPKNVTAILQVCLMLSHRHCQNYEQTVVHLSFFYYSFVKTFSTLASVLSPLDPAHICLSFHLVCTFLGGLSSDSGEARFNAWLSALHK